MEWREKGIKEWNGRVFVGRERGWVVNGIEWREILRRKSGEWNEERSG